MAHTPGPWNAGTDEDANIVYDAQLDFVAETTRDDGDAEQEKANACLIAAAPALLASLKEMVADLIAHASLGLNEKEVAMLQRAEAAIAQAEAP